MTTSTLNDEAELSNGESVDGGSDGSARSDDEGDSDHSSIESYSSSDSDGSSSSGDDAEESYDGDDYPHQDGEANNDEYFGVGEDELSCEQLPDEDIKSQKNRRRRLAILILMLSTLLAVLFINMGYVMLQLTKARSGSQPLNDDETVKENGDTKSQTKSNNYHEAKANEKNGDRTKRNKIQNLEDNEEYKMPKYPTRIYTHSALSSKNYRAGGVLSDEMLHRFEEDGVIVIRNLVSPKLMDRLDMASQMLIDGQDEGSMKKKRGKQFHMVKNGAVFLGVPPRKGGPVCTTNNANEDESCEVDAETDNDDIILSSFRDLAMYTKIPRVAASLLRLDELRVGGEQYLKPNSNRRRRHAEKQEQNKEQGEEKENDEGDDMHIDESVNLRICRDIFLTKDNDTYACGWHVDDTGFWPSLASDSGVNAWVALDDMPAPPRSGNKGASRDKQNSKPGVATFALSLGSHRAPWRHEAYKVTGSTHTVPLEGYQSAADLIQRRSGSGTCNIQNSSTHLYENLEKNKVIYDLKRGDVIFHHRWVFHRTVTVSEYKMANGNSAQEQDAGEGEPQPASQEQNQIFRRYSIRYAPGTATVPPGYGVELSALYDFDNANRTLDEIVERSGPWYPKVWPHVLKTKPLQQSSSGEYSTNDSDEEEEIEGITELVYDMIPQAEELQKKRKKEIQRLLSLRGAQ